MLPENDPALLLIQRIRDEAHRFAVTFHRKARSMRDLRSELDEVPGIGPRRRRALLHRVRQPGRRAARHPRGARIGRRGPGGVGGDRLLRPLHRRPLPHGAITITRDDWRALSAPADPARRLHSHRRRAHLHRPRRRIRPPGRSGDGTDGRRPRVVSCRSTGQPARPAGDRAVDTERHRRGGLGHRRHPARRRRVRGRSTVPARSALR